jgi:hypothetical protein
LVWCKNGGWRNERVVGPPTIDFWNVIFNVPVANLVLYGRKHVCAENFYLCFVVVFNRWHTTFLEII